MLLADLKNDSFLLGHCLQNDIEEHAEKVIDFCKDIF